MPGTNISRSVRTLPDGDVTTVTAGATAGASTAIALADAAAARVYWPAAIGANGTATLYDLDPSTGSYVIAQDRWGTALTVPITASRSVNLPDEIFPAVEIKIVTDSSALTIGLVLKS